MIRKLALASLTLISLAVPANALAARGMEFALQDDAVFVDQRWMARDKALEHAAELGTKRIRVNVLWSRVLTSDASHKTAPADGPVYDFSRIDALQAAAAKRNIKLQLTVSGPAPAWATADQQGRRLQARPGQVRRLRAHRRRPLQGPRGPLRDLERAEPERLAGADVDEPGAVPQPLQERLHRDQDRRPQGQGAVRRARPEPRRPHDRPDPVPQGRRARRTPS